MAVISIIIPTFNRPSKVSNAVCSVLQQGHNNVEIIVINDGGLKLSSLGFDENIVKIIEQKHLGRSSARNRGLHEATGDFVFFLDDDDLLFPGFLMQALALVLKAKTRKIYKFLLNHKNKHDDMIEAPFKFKNRNELIYKTLFHGMSVSQLLIPYNTAKEFLFDSQLDSCEDQDYILRLEKSAVDFTETEIVSVTVNENIDVKATSFLIKDLINRSKINSRYGTILKPNQRIKKVFLDFKNVGYQMIRNRKLMGLLIICIIALPLNFRYILNLNGR